MIDLGEKNMTELAKIENLCGDPSFWGKARHVGGDNGCWLWGGSICIDGYGMYKGKKAHRVSYIAAYGSIPDGKQVNHRCGNPSCINPSHLYAGTQSENMRDVVAMGRFNYRPRFLNSEIVRDVRNSGVSASVAAKIMGCSRSHARNVLNGNRWANAT